MKRAAIGIRVHSGWGALVALSGNRAGVEVIDRKRIVIADPEAKGASQPYHAAQDKELREAEKFLAECAAVSERLAASALGEIVRELGRRDYRVVGCGILLAAGRTLPALPETLASHALIHTAEGEFFRRTFRKACERLNIPVTGIRERDLDERVETTCGAAASQLRREIAGLGTTLGPPWTSDQKNASLAASVVLKESRA